MSRVLWAWSIKNAFLFSWDMVYSWGKVSEILSSCSESCRGIARLSTVESRPQVAVWCGGGMRRIIKSVVLIGVIFVLSGCVVGIKDGQDCWDRASVDPTLLGVWKWVHEDVGRPEQDIYLTEKDGAYDITIDGTKHARDIPPTAKSIAVGTYRFLVFFDPKRNPSALLRYEVEGNTVTLFIVNTHLDPSSSIDITPYLAEDKSRVVFDTFDDFVQVLLGWADSKLSYGRTIAAKTEDDERELSVLRSKTLWLARFKYIKIR